MAHCDYQIIILTTITRPIPSKAERAQLHKAIRELFERQLETFTDENKASEGGPRTVTSGLVLETDVVLQTEQP